PDRDDRGRDEPSVLDAADVLDELAEAVPEREQEEERVEDRRQEADLPGPQKDEEVPPPDVAHSRRDVLDHHSLNPRPVSRRKTSSSVAFLTERRDGLHAATRRWTRAS